MAKLRERQLLHRQVLKSERLRVESLSEADWRAEMERCKGDYGYFRSMYLPVVDRENPQRTVRFRLRPAQKAVLRAFAANGSSRVLKFRRAGVSRVVESRLLHKSRFNANVASITVVHSDEDARELFKQVREWEAGLPAWMKQGPFALKKETSDQLYWKHGGMYRVVSAQSTPAGGATWWYRHYSEEAKYKDAERTIRIIEGGSATHGRQVHESTAEGLGYFFEQWRAENGEEKLFLPWTSDPEYKMDEEQARALGYAEPEMLLYDEVRAYARSYGLTRHQALWMGAKLASTGFNPQNPDECMRGFHREFPITAELAFTTAAGRVFKRHFPSARGRAGLRRYGEPEPYHIYVLGADAASGARDGNGDYSAWCVLDWTNPERPKIVSTFYDRIGTPEFAELVGAECKKYGALLVCGRAAWDRDVMTRVIDDGWGLVWRETRKDRVTGQLSEILGHSETQAANAEIVSLLQEYLNGGGGEQPILDPVDERLQYEMNDYQWLDGMKAEAAPPNHDDMIRATGMALKGKEQMHLVKVTAGARRPVTLDDKLQYRLAHDGESTPLFEVDEFDELLAGRGARGLRSVSDLIGNR